MEKKRRFFLYLVQKKNWQVSAARNKQDCFLLLTLASFFLKKISRHTSLVLLKNGKKVKVFVVFGSKKNWQVSAARKKQDCFLLLTLASFFFKKISRNTSLFLLKNGKKVKVFVVFGSKKKLASVSSYKQTRLFLAIDTCQFFFKENFEKRFTFFTKKWKKSEGFCYIWFKKKTGKCQQPETNKIVSCY